MISDVDLFFHIIGYGMLLCCFGFVSLVVCECLSFTQRHVSGLRGIPYGSIWFLRNFVVFPFVVGWGGVWALFLRGLLRPICVLIFGLTKKPLVGCVL